MAAEAYFSAISRQLKIIKRFQFVKIVLSQIVRRSMIDKLI